MRKIFIIILSFMMIVMIGCSRKAAKEADLKLFNQSVADGIMAIEDENYSGASTMFKFALEENHDAEVANLKKQTDYMVEIKNIIGKYRNIESILEKDMSYRSSLESAYGEIGSTLDAFHDDIKKAIDLCDNILGIYTKSQLLVDAAKESKSEFEDVCSVIEDYRLIKEEEYQKKEAYEAEMNYVGSDFTGNDAVRYAMNYYGVEENGDIVFQYNNEPEYNEHGKCYKVVLKSREMTAEGGTDTMFWIMVSQDGTIMEL